MWFLQINTPCKFLSPDYSCSIYSKRPHICREYGFDDCSGEVLCDHITNDEKHDMEFYSDKDIEMYILKRFPKKKKNKI